MAHSYTLSTSSCSSLPKPVNRASGWGYLLGDEGSAFGIGRDAIRAALNQHDRGLSPTPLHLALTKHFGCESIKDLIPAVYMNLPPIPNEGQDLSSAESDPKLRVAGVCRIVFGRAFPPSSDELPGVEALDIVRRHASLGADTIIHLLARDQDLPARQSALVFGGALGQVEGYRSMIMEILRSRGHHFSRVEYVSAAAEVGVKMLVRDYLT
jgi:N-acetylmuramic acid 6-phosphate etherase